MTATAVLHFTSRGIVVPLSSLYAESLGADYVIIGLLGTATALALIVFSTVWGRVSDRLGRRKLVLIPSLLVMGLGYGLMALAPDYRALLPLYVLVAVAQAGYDANSLALLGDLLDMKSSARGRYIGMFRGLCSLGFGAMAFFAGTIAEWQSLRAVFVVTAGLLLGAALVAFGVTEGKQPSPSSEFEATGGAPPGGASARPAVAEGGSAPLPLPPLLVAAFAWSLMFGAVYAVWANYMVNDLHYTTSQMSRLWAIASLSEFPLMVVAGRLSDHIGRLPMLSLGFLAWALVFVGYLLLPQMPWIVLVQLVRGFAFSAFTATAMAYAAEVRSRGERGKVSGLYSSAGAIGSILGAPLGGTMAQLLGFRTMIAFNAIFIALGAVYLAIAARRWNRRSGHSV